MTSRSASGGAWTEWYSSKWAGENPRQEIPFCASVSHAAWREFTSTVPFIASPLPAMFQVSTSLKFEDVPVNPGYSSLASITTTSLLSPLGIVTVRLRDLATPWGESPVRTNHSASGLSTGSLGSDPWSSSPPSVIPSLSESAFDGSVSASHSSPLGTPSWSGSPSGPLSTLPLPSSLGSRPCPASQPSGRLS